MTMIKASKIKSSVFMISACNQSAVRTKGRTCVLKITVNEHLRLTNWFADIVLFLKMRPVGVATSDMQYYQYFNKVLVSHGLKLFAMWEKIHPLQFFKTLRHENNQIKLN